MAVATLKSMSTDEVANWIMTLPGSHKLKNKAVAAIRENEITGEDLAGMERDELYEIGIPRIFTFKLWNGIKVMSENEKRARTNKRASIQDKMAEMRTQAEELRKQREEQKAIQAQESVSSITFAIPIVVGTMQKLTRVMFEPWDTVFKLKQAIVDQEGGDIDNLNLICNGKVLIDNKTLKESGINGKKPVSEIFRVRGRINKRAAIQDKMAKMMAQAEQARRLREEQRAKAASKEKESVSSNAFRIPIVLGTMQKLTRAMFEPWDTVFKLKQAIVDQEGGEIGDLNLICKGKVLIDDKTLQESGINGLKPVIVTFRVRGGPPAIIGIYTVHVNESDGQWTANDGEIKFDGNEFKGTVRYDNHTEYCPLNGKIDEQRKCTFKIKYYGSWYDYKCDFKEVDGSVGFVGLWKSSSADSFPSSQTVVLKLVKKE